MDTADGERAAITEEPVIVVVSEPEEERPPGLEQLEGEAHLIIPRDREAFARALPRADVLLVTDFRRCHLEEVWSEAKRLRWVHATMAGVDAVLFPELVESDVVLTNARGFFDRTIAEYVLGWILAFAKDFPRTLALQAELRFEHRDTERVEGQRVVVLGAGSIGSAIGRMTRAVGMPTVGLARRARQADECFDAVYAIGELHALLPTADYLVIAAPLTDETRGLVGARELAAMKPTARLLNIGRGPIVDTDALVDALHERRIAGAMLDVFEEEPLPSDHPIWETPSLVVSPHMAGDFHGWREALVGQFADNLKRWRRGEALSNVVDKRRGYVPSSEGAGHDHD